MLTTTVVPVVCDATIPPEAASWITNPASHNAAVCNGTYTLQLPIMTGRNGCGTGYSHIWCLILIEVEEQRIIGCWLVLAVCLFLYVISLAVVVCFSVWRICVDLHD